MKRKNAISMALAGAMLTAAILPGCGADENSGKTEIEILQYKPEAAAYFDKVEEEFNASHDDIHLTISSPNDASTIMRTRFVREDYPDITRDLVWRYQLLLLCGCGYPCRHIGLSGTGGH